MNLGRCPVCHAHISLEAVVQDDAGRELLALLAGMPSDAARALVRYLGLFRAPKRDLTNDRTLRLAREVLALDGAAHDSTRLAWALTETVESIRSKGGATPIKGHGYLKRVLEGAGAQQVAQQVAQHASPQLSHEPRAARPLQSKTALAMANLVEGV